MSANKYEDHVVVLPEEAANHNIATGFKQRIPGDRQTRLQVLPAAGGWIPVFDALRDDLALSMRRFVKRRLVLLIDFDGQPDRLSDPKAKIPLDIADRVFVIGVRTEPEALRAARKLNFKQLGEILAAECRDGVSGLWSDELLRHNAAELARLQSAVRPILFPAPL